MTAGEFNELAKQGEYGLRSWLILVVNTGWLRKFPV